MKSRPRHNIGALVALQGYLRPAVQAAGTDGRGDTTRVDAARARRRLEIVMASAENTALPAGRRWSLRGMAVLLAMGAGLHASPALAQLSCSNVYATNPNGEIYRTSDGGSQSLVGSVTGLPAAINAFGISSNGSRLYLATSGTTAGTSGRVSIVNASTFAVTNTSAAPTLVANSGGFNAGAVNPVNGWFYLAGPNQTDSTANGWHLYAFNPATPASAPIRVGQITGTAGNNGDLTFDTLGNLFLLSGNASNSPQHRIYRVGQVPTSAGTGSLPATVLATVSSGATENVGGIAFTAAGALMTSMQGGVIALYNPLTGERIVEGNFLATAISDLASCAGGSTITLRKDLPQGRAVAGNQFTLQLSGGGLGTTQTATTTGTASGVQAATIGPLLAVDDASFQINEAAAGSPSAVLANYARSWQCIDAADGDAVVASGSTFPGTVTIPTIRTGSSVECTITNGRMPILRLQKALPNGRAVEGNQFSLAITGTGAPAAVTTGGNGSTVTGTVTHSTATAGSVYTLSESAAGTPTTVLANYTTTYACTNALAGGQTPSGTGTSFDVTPVAGDDLTCTFTNTRATRLTLIKTVTNDDGGTRLPTAWTLSASGPTSISGTTGSAAVTNAAVSPGTYTLSESALPAGYSASPYTCTINGGVPVSGNSVTIATGDNVVCRIHNDDVGTPGPPATCGITSHAGPSSTAPVFGPGGVNASIALENVTFDAGSTAGGSITRFVDSNGRTYSTPAGPGRWLLTNSSTTTRVTITFSPSIPAHRIGIGIYDIGVWDATLPNNGEDASYAPRLTLGLSGGAATTSQFVAHRTGLNATQASYTPGSGVVTLDAGAYVPGTEGTWRQSVFLRGNANALVSTLTLTATNIKPGDNIGFGLVAIPSCVTISKVTEGGVGSFDFTTTNVNNWDNTASASPVTLTTTATGTPVNSARHYYAHPVASNGQGTQPVVLSETIPPTWVLSPAQCTDANSSRNGNTGSFGSLVGGALTIPADRMRFESNITCSFTNTRAAILRLQKALPDGRAAASDQFTLSMTGTGAPAAVTTTGTGSTATGLLTHDTATPGSAYALAEAAAGGADLSYYTSTYRCTNARAGGQTPAGNGSAFNVTPVAGDDLTCTLTNLRRSADLSIRKTVAEEPLVSGAQAVFTLEVTNHGPGAADGATVRDPAVAGLDCVAAGLPAPTCLATGGAGCPTPLTASGLQSGVAIPALPNGGVVTIGLTCRVTASGLP